MRAFLALALPGEMTRAFAPVQDRLRTGRIVPEEDMHLTLAFLGEVRVDAFDDLVMDLEMLRPGPVQLDAAGIDVFGQDDPRSLHARIAPDPGLLHLQRKVETLVRRSGIALPHRRFVPHVTLARFPRTMPPEDHTRIGRFLAAHADFRAETAWSDRIDLMRSTLTSDGPRYDPIEEFALI